MNKKNKKQQNKKFELKDAKEFVKKHSTTFWIVLTVFLMFYLKLAEEGLSGGKMAEEDFYDILGLSSSASIKDIKK
jgi:preprotein translocase subunit Sec63